MRKPRFQFGLKAILAATAAAAILSAIAHYVPLMIILGFAANALVSLAVFLLLLMVGISPILCVLLVVWRSWQLSFRRAPKD